MKKERQKVSPFSIRQIILKTLDFEGKIVYNTELNDFNKA